MRKLFPMVFIVFLLGCSSEPSRSDVAAIIEKTGILYTSKPVNVNVEVGHMNQTCGANHDTPIYALLQERGFAQKTKSGDLEWTDKGSQLLNRLGVKPYFRFTEHGCDYQSYLLPLGTKKGIDVTGIAQPTDSTMLAKFGFVVELNELGREMTVGSAFCNKYSANKPEAICPDVNYPFMFPMAGKDGFATTGSEEANLVKFDDGWKIR